MDASIVIPTYNKLTQLKSILASLQELDYARESFEVLVVDDGSKDGTESFLSKVRFPFRLTVLRHESNRGRAAARNTGIRRAGGRVVVFLDDDMMVVPEFLKAHLGGQAEGHRRVVLGNIRSAPQVSRTALVRYLDSRGIHKLNPGQSIPFRYFATGNVSVERDLLMTVGLFDERITEFGGEDLELGYRLHKAGAEFVYATKAHAWRTDYGDIPALCEKMETYGECSLPIVLQAHPELKELVKAHLLEPMATFSDPLSLTIKKALFRLILWPPFGKLGVRLAKICNPISVPAYLFDWLILFHYMKGFRRSSRKRGLGS